MDVLGTPGAGMLVCVCVCVCVCMFCMYLLEEDQERIRDWWMRLGHQGQVCSCVCLCLDVCMCVCMYVCMYVCIEGL